MKSLYNYLIFVYYEILRIKMTYDKLIQYFNTT